MVVLNHTNRPTERGGSPAPQVVPAEANIQLSLCRRVATFNARNDTVETAVTEPVRAEALRLRKEKGDLNVRF